MVNNKSNQITPAYLTLGLKLQVPDQILNYARGSKCWRNVNDDWKSWHRKDFKFDTQDTGNQHKLTKQSKLFIVQTWAVQGTTPNGRCSMLHNRRVENNGCSKRSLMALELSMSTWRDSVGGVHTWQDPSSFACELLVEGIHKLHDWA